MRFGGAKARRRAALSGGPFAKLCQLLYHGPEGLCRVNLMCARPAKERFGFGEVSKNAFPLFLSLPKGVRSPALDPVEEHRGGSAQQNNRVKVPVEPALI